MWSGVLNEKLEVYVLQKVKDVYGQEVTTPVLSHSYRCGVSHNSTSRTVINSEIQYPYTKFFIVRIYADITENDWIKYNNKFYRILSIEENREMQNKRIDVEVINE